MPAKKERCVSHVRASGKSESSAWAICTAAMKKGKRKPRKGGGY